MPHAATSAAPSNCWPQPPRPKPRTGALDGELRALALMIDAARAMEQGVAAEALSLLQEVADAASRLSPLFAVQLLAQAAALAGTQPEPMLSGARRYYRAALDLLDTTTALELATDLWMQLALFCQENAHCRESWFTEAIGATVGRA